MKLRDWRKSQVPKMTLATAAPLFDLPVSSLSDLERGAANVSRETLARIEGVTGGQVTADDMQAAFKDGDHPSYSEHRAAGRSAMQAYRKAAKKPRKAGD